TTVRLRKGINRMLFDISGTHHLLQFTMGLRAHQKLKVRRIVTIGNFTDDEAFKRVWNAGDYRIAPKELIKDVPDYAIANTNVWALTAWDTVAAYPAHLRIENADALLSTNNEWAVIHPCEAKGKDVRLLIDFGQEMLAYIEFEVDAPAGTIIDFNMFEGILDGRVQLTHGLNNSMRYICREGRQRYRSYVKRGFRYMFVVFRNMTAPVKVRYIIARLSTYPMPKRGAFRCSDERLNQIWEVGRRTLQMCMDDTYLDCPAYEQTHWVGDARNEALVNWVVTGDPRITAHCILQTADSLKRSPLPESHVPSGWQNILTAWSLLWIRSIREHWQFTGDGKFLRKIYPALQTTCENLIQYRNKKGLLEIEAWNMLDWAPMDTPSKGVVTHQNMLMVRALREAAEIARTLQHTEDAERWERIADELKHAINEHLWSDERGAFVDCIRADGTLSPVVSQQTNTMALLCDCVDGERAERLRQFILHPPEGVVTAGSPFFLFFLLEQLARDGRAEEMLTLIRDKWGFMLDKGATTFWETIPRTRSWCHAWSAAPTYFLSTVVLGVYPEQPGFSVVGIEPHPVDLKWCHGSMPTPMGDVIVKWERPEVGFKLRAEIPPKLPAHMSLPIYGNAKRIFINGVEALPDKLPEGVDSISITATRIHIYLSRGGVWVVELKE
ncbi:MAG TPA: hypothetical protein EYP10_09940, partial [Armatimonadetes bacterium]|nr:hypothetical protein [Armatimonadota bacterium]